MRRRRLTRPVLHAVPVQEDVARELHHHVEERAGELVAAGWAPDAARAEAERLLGNRVAIEREMQTIERASRRARRRAGMLESVRQDLKFAGRTLRRSPGYTLVALLTLLLGIGANTAVFSVVNGVLLRPLPYPEPERLVRVWEVNPAGDRMGSAWRNFADWRERARSFEALVAHDAGGGSISVLTGGVAEHAQSALVSRGFFEVLGALPAVGRDFAPEEQAEGAVPVVVVSHAFWTTRLGAAPLEGLRLNADGLDVAVVGVAPAGFSYPEGTDLWVPMEIFEQTQSRTAHNWRTLGRLAPGVSLAQANAELDVITASFLEESSAANVDGTSAFWPAHAEVVGLREAMVGNTRRALLILLGAAGLVLLVACTNLASTTLARGTARIRELAVRRSLGAGRARVIRQLFTESLLLAVLGAALGTALAVWLVRLLPLLAPEGFPRLDQVRVDGPVLAFTVAAAILTAVLTGLLPALRDSAGELAATLRSGTRGGSGRRENRVWSGLVALEVALALMLLVGSGLLLRSFWSVLAVDPGYVTEDVLTVSISPPAGRYPDGATRTRFFQEVLETVEAVPGVARVGLASAAPMAQLGNGRVDVSQAATPFATGYYQLVTPGYYDVLRIPLLRGRMFDGGEVPDQPHVALVNQAFADAVWPGEDPIGKRLTGGGMDEYYEQDRWATVIGVVGNVRQRAVTDDPELTYYFPLGQRLERTRSMSVVLTASAGPPVALAPAVRQAVARVDVEVPLAFSTIEERLAGALTERRFTLTLLLGFAGVALLLACVGIYGVVSYAVERRTKEIGIRMALGAQPVAVRRLVRRHFLGATAIGLLAGGAAALWLTRLLEALLYGVAPADPLTFAAMVLVLAGAAWTASYLPSLKASRVSPMETMRAE